jgi:hypothetical protein
MHDPRRIAARADQDFDGSREKTGNGRRQEQSGREEIYPPPDGGGAVDPSPLDGRRECHGGGDAWIP